MKAYQLDPADTLFFRDARPMQAGAGSGGHGANWPLPNVLHEGLRANLLAAAGVPRASEPIEIRVGSRHKRIGSHAFQSLRTIGPWPVLEDEKLFLPRPLDIVPVTTSAKDGTRVTALVPATADGEANWPEGITWLRALNNPSLPTKAELPEWVSLDWLRDYLATPGPWRAPSTDADDRLYDAESRIGIEIEREKGSVKEGQLYASEHLRLRPGVSLWFRAGLGETEIEERRRGLTVDKLLGAYITLGGESRIARLRAASLDNIADGLPAPSGKYIKWVLASPAVFTGGWRPGWIDPDTGRVMLRAERPARQSGETRRRWRARIEQSSQMNAKLVAVCCGKPLHFSGWDQDARKPKPTMLAVPSGSVYYFETDNETAARALVNALHGRVRSDFFGEKGLGLGFCGCWPEKR